MSRKSLPCWLFALMFGACTIVYWPGLDGPFLLDDDQNLYGFSAGVTSLQSALDFTLGGVSGPSGRPVAMASFLLDDQFSPPQPWKFKYTNLMIHLMCGCLVLWLLHLLLLAMQVAPGRAALIAVLSAGTWLLHPLNVSSVLYVVQRMNQLAALFTLAALVTYVWFRLRGDMQSVARLGLLSVLFTGFAILAVLSKENGALVLFYVLCIEVTLLVTARPPTQLMKGWILLFVVLPITTGSALLLYKFDALVLGGYAVRDFTIVERVLTECRVLFSYLSYILFPRLHGMGLMQDDYAVSTGLFSPVTTAFAVAGLAVAVAVSVATARKLPVLSFSILWFIAGHLLESSFLALEIYFEHRNYLPMVGPLFGATYYIFRGFERVSASRTRRLVMAGAACLVVVFSGLTWMRASLWQDKGQLYQKWFEEHPDSVRASREYAYHVTFNGALHSPLGHQVIVNAYRKNPHRGGLAVDAYVLGCELDSAHLEWDEVLAAMARGRIYKDDVIALRLIGQHKTLGYCPQITLDDVLELFAVAEQAAPESWAGIEWEWFYWMQAELFMFKGWLGPTMQALDQSLVKRKNPHTPLRQAELLMHAGLPAEAAEYLDVAESICRAQIQCRTGVVPNRIRGLRKELGVPGPRPADS